MKKQLIHRVIGLCALLLGLGAHPVMGQQHRVIDNIAATPDCAEPWIFSVAGTVKLDRPPSGDKDRTNWWVVLYTHSGRGGNIRLVTEGSRPRSVPINDFNPDLATGRHWQLDGVWLGNKEANDKQYVLYICLISARTEKDLSGLWETHDKFSNTNQLLEEIKRRTTLHVATEHRVVRHPSNDNTCGPPNSSNGRTTWEYKHAVNSSIEELNALGADRWELVGCSIEGNGNKNFYLKRPR